MLFFIFYFFLIFILYPFLYLIQLFLPFYLLSFFGQKAYTKIPITANTARIIKTIAAVPNPSFPFPFPPPPLSNHFFSIHNI